MFDFLSAWFFVVVRGGAGRRVLSNTKYRSCFGGALDTAAADPDRLGTVRWVILRKTRMNEVPLPLVRALGGAYSCRAENRRFIVLGRGGDAQPSAFFDEVFGRLTAMADDDASPSPLFDTGHEARTDPAGGARRSAVVSTFNRPQALARTLPQIVALGVPTLVVDDGSAAVVQEENATIARENDADYIALPSNRGVAAAINVGIDYWLADPGITWISYFQDDVDVDPTLFEVLAKYEYPGQYPVITGLDTNEHAADRIERDGDRTLKFKHNSTGMHLHCHRDYWSAVLPIPTRYLGAPKAGQGGSGADAWIVKRAPAAVTGRGLPVLCVAGLVTTYAWRGEDSTWGNQHLLDGGAAPFDNDEA